MTPEHRRSVIARRRHAAGGATQALHKVWLREAWRYEPVWEVPVEALVLNVDNKRFAAERDIVEHELGHPLDPANSPEDEDSVIAILCDTALEIDRERKVAVGSPSKDYLALREDWLRRRQAEPLWIRPDGTVRNGNRRLAMIKRLRSDGEDISWVDAIILDESDVDEAELFRMEQREQLAENFKKRYADINALLALKEAAELEQIDWQDPDSLRDVARRLKHYAGKDDARYATVQLQAIKGIDAYLDYLSEPGSYRLVTGQVEVFREVGQCLALMESEPEDGPDLLATAFSFVQSRKRYQDLRSLRKMFIEDRSRFLALAEQIRKQEDTGGWGAEDEPQGVIVPDLDVVTSRDDQDDNDADDADADDAPPPAVGAVNYPRTLIEPLIDEALDAFGAAQLDVPTLLQQARSRLEAVGPGVLASALADDPSGQVSAHVEWLTRWADEARTT